MRFHAMLGGLCLLAGCVTGHSLPPSVTPPRMIAIVPGRFVAGSDPAETFAAHYPDANVAREQPTRTIVVAHRFAIGRTEVTRGEFARFVAATGWNPTDLVAFWPMARPTDGMWTWPMTGNHPVSGKAACIPLSASIWLMLVPMRAG